MGHWALTPQPMSTSLQGLSHQARDAKSWPFEQARLLLARILRLRLTDAERDLYWPKLDAMYPDFVDYRSYTDRKIPIVFLDPA